MATPIPFLPYRFGAAASHYGAGRTPYAPRLVQHVATLAQPGRSHGVLDVRRGHGHWARVFAPSAQTVGRPRSMSSINPDRDEARVETVAVSVLDARIQFAADSVLTEIVQTRALIATRPEVS
jgi:hypothetical protein